MPEVVILEKNVRSQVAHRAVDDYRIEARDLMRSQRVHQMQILIVDGQVLAGWEAVIGEHTRGLEFAVDNAPWRRTLVEVQGVRRAHSVRARTKRNSHAGERGAQADPDHGVRHRHAALQSDEAHRTGSESQSNATENQSDFENSF